MGKFDGLLLASDFDDTLYGLDLRIPERIRNGPELGIPIF